MNNIYEKLLIEYCDALMSLQDKSDDAAFRGGIKCRACKMIHGRCPDAIYGFTVAYKITGNVKYLDAAKLLFDYADNMLCTDGSLYNDAQANWRFTSNFFLTSLIETLNSGKDLYGKEYSDKMENRAKAVAEWLYLNLNENSRANINYATSNGLALALTGTYFNEKKYLERAKKLIYYALAHVTENGLLYGESLPHDFVSDKKARSVDIGYNVEETIPALVKYAFFTDDNKVRELARKIVRAHLFFMLPDGAWDNSFGVRNNKWTYWGSRTSDGCAPMFLLFAETEPEFVEAALRNTELLKKCSKDGFLFGGRDYILHNEHACTHHTFEHINSLAYCIEHVDGKFLAPKRVSIPSDRKDVFSYYSETLTYKLAKGNYLATVTDNDFNVFFSWHATGGTITALYGRNVGPMIMASVTDYILVEPTNMQQSLDVNSHRSLTPRFIKEIDGIAYHSSYYRFAKMNGKKSENECIITVKTGLCSKTEKKLEDFEPTIIYSLSEKGLKISAENADGLKYVLPLIAGKCKVKKGSTEKSEKIFFLTGGFIATEYIIVPEKDGRFEIMISE